MLDKLIRDTDAIARLTGDTLLLVDTAGVILHATPKATALFGREAGQLTGLPFGIPLAGDDGIEMTMAGTGRKVVMHRENLEAAGLPLFRVHLRDVTTCRTIEAELTRAREAAKAADKAKSHFLANITHEIRTPMIGVLGMTELTLATSLTAKQREYLEMARHSAQSLLTVLNDIVDYARIEIGALELARTPFDLVETVEEVMSIFRPLAIKKGLCLDAGLDDSVPRQLVGDAGRLRQILINLVGNAVKFTDTGSVVLAITSIGRPISPDATEPLLQFSVRDTGIGIPRDKIRAIFDSFTQADVSPARRYQGAGLGLAIVRHLVEMMGGSYRVDSEEGRGSDFSFQMPFAVEPVAQGASSGADNPRKSGPPPLTILLAEDNPINQIYVQELLEMDGHTVVVAHTGRRALEALRRQHFDLILMDIQMPEMDGLEATRAIRADQSGDFDPTIPIVALTAHALKGDREAFLRAGMNEYLSKPVSPADLEAALTRAMGVPGPRRASGRAEPRAEPLAAVLDWGELLSKARGNTGFLMKLFSAFVAEQPVHLETMREALALGDLDHLAFLAHSLKGAAATMCAPVLREACLDVERAAKEQRSDALMAAFSLLEAALADVLAAMRGKLADESVA